MVRVFGLSVMLMIASVALVPSRASEPNPKPAIPVVKPLPAPKELRIGLLQPMFKDVPPALITAAARPFQDMIHKKTGLKGSMNLLPGYRELADAMRDGKIDVAVFHGFEYAWVKDTPGITPLVVAVPNCGSVQACLVVNKTSKAKTPACLKGKARVLVPKGTKAHCGMFLDHIRTPLAEGVCCPLTQAEMSIEEALFAIGGNKADAALVDISSLKALQGNFPGCFAAIKVLDQSIELPAAVIVYRDGALEDKTVKSLKDGLMNCTKTVEGYAFTVFWQLKGFAEVSPKYNEQVEECLKAYPAPGPMMTPAPAPDVPK